MVTQRALLHAADPRGGDVCFCTTPSLFSMSSSSLCDDWTARASRGRDLYTKDKPPAAAGGASEVAPAATSARSFPVTTYWVG